MISKQTRTFTIEGKEYQFNITKFNDLFRRYASKTGASIGEYEQTLADNLFVDRSAIHN